MPHRIHVLLNHRSGTALKTGVTPEAIAELFQAAGHDVTIDADVDRPMDERLDRLRRSNAPIVCAAGGDGTVTAIANALRGSEKVLAILPLGTVNALARDLAIPLDLHQWMASLETMQPRRIDVGEVNGRLFLHKVVIGFIPGVAAAREHVRGMGGMAAKLAFVRFFFRRLFRSRRIAVEISPRDGSARIVRVVAIAVANNEYDEAAGRLFSRSHFDEGQLCVYSLKHLGFGDLFRLSFGMLAGHWREDEALEIEKAGSLMLRTRKPAIKAMLDGEVETFETPLRFSIHPAALAILAPPQAPDEQPNEAPVGALAGA
ncbi:MAG: diacylglycerol/lipid kinase family protein [Devosia sp.]